MSVRFSSPANDHIWFTKKPKVKPVACFNTNSVGPRPHFRVLRKSLVPIGTKNAGPAPQINPFLLAAGEKKPLRWHHPIQTGPHLRHLHHADQLLELYTG